MQDQFLCSMLWLKRSLVFQAICYSVQYLFPDNHISKAFDAYSRIALAALDKSIGFSLVNSILTALDLPNMTRKAYKAGEREVGNPMIVESTIKHQNQ